MLILRNLCISNCSLNDLNLNHVSILSKIQVPEILFLPFMLLFLLFSFLPYSFVYPFQVMRLSCVKTDVNVDVVTIKRK